MAQDPKKAQAEALLKEARRLVDEAGKLAEEGGFTLRFHSGGVYIPKSLFNKELYRVEAVKQAQEDTEAWDELDEKDRKEIVDQYIDDWMRDEVPYTFREVYGLDAGSAGCWWQPSTC